MHASQQNFDLANGKTRTFVISFFYDLGRWPNPFLHRNSFFCRYLKKCFNDKTNLSFSLRCFEIK